MIIPEPPSWFEIPRESPEVDITVGENTYHCTYENTVLFMYEEPYKAMSHLFIQPPNENGTYLFHVPEALDQLWELRFTTVSAVYPSAPDIEAYLVWQHECLEAELNDA